MSSQELPCPIWDGPPSAQDVAEVGQPCYSPRAGGRFLLMPDGAACLHHLSDRQRANLSYRIYRHNLDYRLFDESPGLGVAPPVLDQTWVESNRDRRPSSLDRRLTFLRELMRSDDADSEPVKELQLAAGGCRHDEERQTLIQHAAEQGWVKTTIHPHGLGEAVPQDRINLAGRIHVEEQLRDLGTGRNGFVAMWFDNSMATVFENGIAPAIEDAGYEPVRIDRQEFLGKVDDEIMAEIRKSRFVVADFTTMEECGARGGVYYEAGFAQGLDIPVIHTCRQDRMKAVHFDTNHFNHITWKKPEDLREQLHRRIEATLGRGPGDPSTDRAVD